ncbi:MAG: TspO/MBR family protein [Leadbetterella sp.]
MILRVVLFLILNFAALAIGASSTSTEVKGIWYSALNKAPWTPPGWFFGLVWTTIMICFAVYMSFGWEKAQNKKAIVGLYSIQWILNVSWNPIFFAYHQTGIALLIISLLTLLIGYMQFVNLKTLKSKSLLISPYFVWLIVATSLNLYVCVMN